MRLEHLLSGETSNDVLNYLEPLEILDGLEKLERLALRLRSANGLLSFSRASWRTVLLNREKRGHKAGLHLGSSPYFSHFPPYIIYKRRKNDL